MTSLIRQTSRTALRALTQTSQRGYTTAAITLRSSKLYKQDAVIQPSYITQQQHGKKTLKFGTQEETVVERSEYPQEKLQQLFKNDVFAVLGYGMYNTTLYNIHVCVIYK